MGLDLSTFRIMGILQRIAIAFVVVSAIELYVPCLATRQAGGLLDDANVRSRYAFYLFRSNLLKWGVALFFFAIGTLLTYAVKPPSSWPGCAPLVYQCPWGEGKCVLPDDMEQKKHMGCSAVGWLDSRILGSNHVYIRGSDHLGATSPNWGFDPEGFITTIPTILTMYFGLYIGLVGKTLRLDPRAALVHWLVVGIPVTVIAAVASLAIPFNKRQWSPTYNFFMCGLATLTYAALVTTCDCADSLPRAFLPISKVSNLVLTPFKWLGANCILFFVLSDCSGVLEGILSLIYIDHDSSPRDVVSWFKGTVLLKWLGLGAHCDDSAGFMKCGPAVMTYVFIQLFFWSCVCGLLYKKGIIWKI